MRVEYWSHSNVLPDGTFENDPEHRKGSVGTKPKMNTSGKHNLQTRSTVEAGLWMLVSTGRLDDGMVHGITIFFDDEAEMRDFSRTRKAFL